MPCTSTPTTPCLIPDAEKVPKDDRHYTRGKPTARNPWDHHLSDPFHLGLRCVNSTMQLVPKNGDWANDSMAGTWSQDATSAREGLDRGPKDLGGE